MRFSAAGCAARVLRLAVVLIHCLLCVEGRIETGTIRFGAAQPSWHFAGKFGFGIGKGNFKLFARFREEPAAGSASSDVQDGMVDVEAMGFLDEEWGEAYAAESCSQKRTSGARIFKPIKIGREFEQVDFSGNLRQTVRPHIWYFALSRCGHDTTSNLLIDYELHLVQEGGSHLSFELSYMRSATLLSIVCVSCFFGFFLARCHRLQQSWGEVHQVIQALAGSALLQLAAQVLHLVHLHVYEAQGASESSTEAFADILFMLSQVVTSSLLIAIARGYTLLSSKEGELRTLRPTAVLIALIHVALVFHSKFQGDYASSHHENGGVAGCMLVAVRLCLCAWFLAGVKGLLLRQPGPSELNVFLRSFRCLGCLYFLSYPAIYIVSKIFAEYLQHPVMHTGLVVMQIAAVLWLSELFLSKRSRYNQVSTLRIATLPQLATARCRTPTACSGSSMCRSPAVGTLLYRSPSCRSPVDSPVCSTPKKGGSPSRYSPLSA